VDITARGEECWIEHQLGRDHRTSPCGSR
jgi:hypothetical protein